MMVQLSPSLLAADATDLGAAAERVIKAGCDEIHFDVMDGHFVPNLTFGPHILKSLKKSHPFHWDVHLMVSDALLFAEVFADAGADNVTVHAEAANVSLALNALREKGIPAGICLRPKTPAEAAIPYLPLVSRILLMTVEPGFGGQKLMPDVLPKAEALRRFGFQGCIQADGGINAENASLLANAGIDNLVMGTAFFRSEDSSALCAAVHRLEARNFDKATNL